MSAHARTHRHRHREQSLESRAARKQRTREELIRCAFELLADRSFSSLSLREVTRAAKLSPTGFYRHFQDMDELGFALVDESVRRLHELLLEARDERPGPREAIRTSVDVLVVHVRENRPQFRFLTRERAGGSPALRRAIRSEIRLFGSELTTDLARFPALRELSSADLGSFAALMVNTMVTTIEELLELPPEDTAGEGRVSAAARTQLQIVAVAAPHWRR